MPVKGFPPVMDIPDEDFAARRSVRAVSRMYHVTHLGGISPPDWQKKPCERGGKTTGEEYVGLDCQGLTLVPPGLRSVDF